MTSTATDAAYRKAAQAIKEAALQPGARQFVFASAFRGEGTTTTALNVARRLRSDHGLNPLLIEIGGARPSLAKWLELDEDLGIGAVANGSSTPAEVIQQDETGLHVIASDGERVNAGAHLVSAALERILGETQESYDVTLIDAPPILTTPHINAVFALVPRVVVVVEAGRTPQEVLSRVARELSEQNVEIVAAILNKHKRYIPNFIYKLLTGHAG